MAREWKSDECGAEVRHGTNNSPELVEILSLLMA